MSALQHQVSRICYEPRFGTRITSPQQEHHRLLTFVEELYYTVSELLPAHTLVAVGLSLADGQHRVQKQHAVIRPGGQLAVLGRIDAKVGLYFLEYVLQ